MTRTYTTESETPLQTTTRPADRVRWSAVIAGFVTAMALMVLLSVLGAAIGLSTYDRGDSERAYGVAAGLWAIISAIIAFFVGGYIAARTAGVFGRENAMLNGAMVWALTIPLSLFFLTGGAMNLLGGAASNPEVTRPIMAGSLPNQNQENINNNTNNNAAGQLSNQFGNNRQDQPHDRAARTAWFTLISLLLGFGAAALGGHVGARGVRYDNDDTDRDAGYRGGRDFGGSDYRSTGSGAMGTGSAASTSTPAAGSPYRANP